MTQLTNGYSDLSQDFLQLIKGTYFIYKLININNNSKNLNAS